MRVCSSGLFVSYFFYLNPAVRISIELKFLGYWKLFVDLHKVLLKVLQSFQHSCIYTRKLAMSLKVIVVV